jgi:hypothetical protein
MLSVPETSLAKSHVFGVGVNMCVTALKACLNPAGPVNNTSDRSLEGGYSLLRTALGPAPQFAQALIAAFG